MSNQDIIEILKDKPELLAEFTLLADAATAKGKVQEANAALITERDTLKSSITALKEKKANGEASPTDIAVLNSLKERLDAVTTEVKTLKTERDTAVAESKQKDLKSAIISAAATHRAMNPEDLFILMAGKKMIGHGEDGKPFFHKINTEGAPVAVTAEEAVVALKTSSPNLFAASGTRGSGTNPAAGTAQPAFDAMKHL